MRLPATNCLAGGASQIYLYSYEEWLGLQAMTPNTRRVYHSRIKHFLLFLEYANLSDRPLANSEIMQGLMQLYLQFLKTSKNAPRSINANINALKNFAQHLGTNNCHLTRVRSYCRSTHLLTAPEKARFLRSVDRQKLLRDKALALVLYSTGMRIGQCARLNIGDIYAGGSGIHVADGVDCHLNETTALAMLQWLEECRSRRQATTDAPLWPSTEGKRLSVRGISYIIERIGRQVRLPVSVEMLRRSWLAGAKSN